MPSRTPIELEPCAPGLELSNYTGYAHFDSLESECTLAHRIPIDRAGEAERIAIARIVAGAAADGESQSEPASPRDLSGLSGASVAQHVRTELIRSISGGAGAAIVGADTGCL